MKPTASSHIVLLRQSNGSYTGYEMVDAAPYSVLKTTPNFQNQLTLCPPPPAGVTVGQPQAFARLASGGYLFLQRSDVFGIPGNYFGVNVLQFDGSMNLAASSSLTLSGGPLNPGIAQTLALADLNGDGIPDMIAGTSYPHSAGLQVLLGSGGVNFQTPMLYPLATSFTIESVIVADLNGDNKPDLIVAGEIFSTAAGRVSVFLGNGDGTFQPEKDVATPSSSAIAVAVGDLNGDGKPDLVFTTNNPGLGAVLVALGNGDGTLSTPVSYPSKGAGPIAIGDVNGDGFADVVVGGVSILLGDGTGTFPNRRDYIQQTAGSQRHSC